MEWTNRIVITKNEVSKKPEITVEGLWTGKDRMIINRHLVRYMRKAASDILKLHRQTDLKTQPEELKVIKELEVLNKVEDSNEKVTIEYRDGTVETEVVKEAVIKENIKEEEIVKCPKTKKRTWKRKKLLMRKKKG